MQQLLRRQEVKLAALAKIIKLNKVDKMITYHQLQPDKDKKILFGWQEVNTLPTGKELVLSRPKGKRSGEVSLSTKEDYEKYFKSIVGVSHSDLLASQDDHSFEGIKLNRDFALLMAKFLVDGKGFSWDNKMEYLLLDDKIS